jgi:hypothetical protein
MVPVRATPVFAATLYETLPFPVPLAPEVMVIHRTFEVATQLQPELPVTVTVPVVAADVVRFEDAGARVTVQDVPACVTVNVCPPIVIVPVREVVPAFAATL